MTTEASWDIQDFDKQWREVAEEVLQTLLASPEMQEMNQRVHSAGHLEFSDRDIFINLINKVKYEVIHAKFGDEGTEDYNNFYKVWQRWHKLHGVSMPKPSNTHEDNIYHLLFGSTPAPENFLRELNQDNQ